MASWERASFWVVLVIVILVLVAFTALGLGIYAAIFIKDHDFSSLSADVANLKASVAALQTTVSQNSNDIVTINTTLGTLTAQVNTNTTNITNIQGDIALVKTDMITIKANEANILEAIAALDAQTMLNFAAVQQTVAQVWGAGDTKIVLYDLVKTIGGISYDSGTGKFKTLLSGNYVVTTNFKTTAATGPYKVSIVGTSGVYVTSTATADLQTAVTHMLPLGANDEFWVQIFSANGFTTTGVGADNAVYIQLVGPGPTGAWV